MTVHKLGRREEIFAGKLDRRIEIQRLYSDGVDRFGHVVKDWRELITVWAHKEELSDGERWRAGEVAANVSARFQIRWSPTTSTVGPEDRILYDGRTYEISHRKELGRRIGIELTTSARGEFSGKE